MLSCLLAINDCKPCTCTLAHICKQIHVSKFILCKLWDSLFVSVAERKLCKCWWTALQWLARFCVLVGEIWLTRALELSSTEQKFKENIIHSLFWLVNIPLKAKNSTRTVKRTSSKNWGNKRRNLRISIALCLHNTITHLEFKGNLKSFGSWNPQEREINSKKLLIGFQLGLT